MGHFPPSSVPLRTPHDIQPSHHFMHSHAVYQQYLRAQQEARIPYHLPRYVINNFAYMLFTEKNYLLLRVTIFMNT